MQRRLIAVALAATVLPFAALDAAAAPGAFKQFGRTPEIYCSTDGDGRIWVANHNVRYPDRPVIKSGIQKGTKLLLKLWSGDDNPPITRTVTVPRTINAGEKIELDRVEAKRFCSAHVIYRQNVKIMTKPSPFQTGPNPRAKRTAS